MDIGIQQSLATPLGTLNLNEDFETGYGKAQFLVQKIVGMDGAGIRNPTTMKPLKSGAIIHQFKRAPRIFTITGEIVADNPAARWYAQDLMRGHMDSIVEADGTYLYTPPVPGYQPRYLTVREYDVVDMSNLNYGPAGSKEFDIVLIAGDWRAYSAGADTITIPVGGTELIPNSGNTEAWLTFNLWCNGSAINHFTLTDEDTGFKVTFDGTDIGTNWLAQDPLSTRHGFIDMMDETLNVSGGHEALAGVNFTSSDFFSVPVGGANISLASEDNPDATITVDPLDAWV